MMPEDALIELLNRVATLPRTGTLFNDDELAQWPGEAVTALKAQKLINKVRPALSAVCPGCEDECLMPVHMIPVTSGDPALFVVCDKRSDVNRVEIPPSRLTQWRANAEAVAKFIAACLSLRFSGKWQDGGSLLEIGIAIGHKRSQMLCLQCRYSHGIPNLDLVLKAHSGDPERVDRGSRPPVYLCSPRLSIGLSPQPEVLRGLAAKPGFRGRGLIARFLYLLPPSVLGYRTLDSVSVPEAVGEAYTAGIRAMLDWDEHGDERPYLLRLSHEAYSEWHAFAQAIEVQMRLGNELEHFTDWAGKAPGAAARLVGVLHGIKHAHGRPREAVITAETMNDALEIMTVITRHSLAALEMMGADPTIADARQVWHWIERHRLPHFTVREAFNALRGTFPRVQRLREALEALEERGYIEIIEPLRDGPGRPPSPTLRVRPGIVEAWR